MISTVDDVSTRHEYTTLFCDGSGLQAQRQQIPKQPGIALARGDRGSVPLQNLLYEWPNRQIYFNALEHTINSRNLSSVLSERYQFYQLPKPSVKSNRRRRSAMLNPILNPSLESQIPTICGFLRGSAFDTLQEETG